MEQVKNPMDAVFAQRIKKGEFCGWGAVVQGIGLLLTLTIVGAIVGIPLMIKGTQMAYKWLCSNCRNRLTSKEVRICPVCSARFE